MLVAASSLLAVATLSAQGEHATTADKQGEPKGWSAPLQSDDIGNPAIPGYTKATNGGLDIAAGGEDTWGTSVEFRFAHQKRTGDFDVAVRVESLTAPHLYSRAGIMAREDLSPDSRHVFFLVFPDNRPRRTNTAPASFSETSRQRVYGLRKHRRENWKIYGSYFLDLPATVCLGLALTSHPVEASTTARFKDLDIPGFQSIPIVFHL
jgi:hypothetical protein